MDIRFHEQMEEAIGESVSCVPYYQGLVNRAYDDAWPTLASMGRPVWDRADARDLSKKAPSRGTIEAAASMLLAGHSANELSSFVDATLCGVASLLCRIGVFPTTWSPLAQEAVADFMATLVHVTVSHDQLVTTYSSEPVLTFGAATVWYDSTSRDQPHARLVQHIISYFRMLLCRDVVDTGRQLGGLVGRIVMLLAMGATGLAATADPSFITRLYTGEFYSVEDILNVLCGDGPLAVLNSEGKEVTKVQVSKVEHMVIGWREWKVGFSHFIQLTGEPSEGDLWAMLARRAAGVFPHSYGDVDLLIPIFKGTELSVILVQFTIGERASFPFRMMRPSSILASELKAFDPNNVIRVHMTLQPKAEASTREQCYVVDPNSTAPSAYVLRLDGVQAWNTQVKASVVNRDEIVPVVTEALTKPLQTLLELWWETKPMVTEDYRCRRSDTPMHPDVALSTTSRLSIESLASDDWLEQQRTRERDEANDTGGESTRPPKKQL